MNRWQKPDSNQSVISINEQNAHLTHKNNTLVQVVDSVVLVHMINLELNIKCGHSITAAAMIICVRYLAAKTISIFVFISSYLLTFFACMDVMNPNIWSCTLSQFFVFQTLFPKIQLFSKGAHLYSSYNHSKTTLKYKERRTTDFYIHIIT